MIEEISGIVVDRKSAWNIDENVGIASKSMWRLFSAKYLAMRKMMRLKEKPQMMDGTTNMKDYTMIRTMTLFLDKPTILITPRSKLLLSTLNMRSE